MQCSDLVDTDDEAEPTKAPAAPSSRPSREPVPAQIAAALSGLSLEDVLGEVFSPAAWSRLSEPEREQLRALLPAPPPAAAGGASSSSTAPDASAQDAAAASVLDNQQLFFGSPLSRFWTSLERGELSAEALAADDRAQEQTARDRVQKLREVHNAMVYRLHYLKREWTPPVPKPPPGYVAASEAGAPAPAGRGRSRGKKDGEPPAPRGRPSLTDGGRPSHGGSQLKGRKITKAKPKAQLAAGGTGHSPSGPSPGPGAGGNGQDGGGGAGGEEGEDSAGELTANEDDDPMETDGRGARGSSFVADLANEVADELAIGARHERQDFAPVEPAGGQKRARSPGKKQGRDTGPSPAAAAGAGAAEAAEGEVPVGLCFFRLVRDTIASVGQDFAPAEYVSKMVAIQANSCGAAAALPRGTALVQYIRSVLMYMATSKAAHGARTQVAATGGPTHGALVDLDHATQSYRWVGAPEVSSVEALVGIEAAHYSLFIAQHNSVVGPKGGMSQYRPMAGTKSTITLPPGSAAQLELFRQEEKARYAAPDAPFAFTLRDGTKAWAPALPPPASKAREHFLLTPERPPIVTLLVLVRDAVVRLPAGEGSRTDVCELLKESAFMVDGVNDAQISTVASGALDRLQGEAEPFVRYDSDRKVWVCQQVRKVEAGAGSEPSAPASE